MSAFAAIGASFFLFGYVLIALERKFNTHRAAIALIMAGTLWSLAAMAGHHTAAFQRVTNDTAVNVFSIVAFTLASMALIEILAHYRFFDYVRTQLLRLKLQDRGQFILLMALCFMLSGVLDNISLTIAFIQVAKRFFRGRNLILASAAIVVASNGGGAWSPIGDTTSILLWLGGKIGAMQMMTTAFIPTLMLVLTAGFLMYRQLDPTDFIKHEEGDNKTELSPSEKLVVGTALFAFVLPLLANFIGVEPYTARLFGLGITWAVIELVRNYTKQPRESHMTANIEKIIQSVDVGSIQYLTGILLSVGALTSLGVLAYLSHVALGLHPSDTRVVAMSSGLGFVSAIMDNTALVAIAMHVFPIHDPHVWGLIGVTAGTGGSLMVFSSAAGVVAMGSMRELTFQRYLRVATVPAFVGMLVAIGTWILEYSFIW